MKANAKKPLKKKSSELNQKSNEISVKKLTLFDHVKHIRQVQSPNYYVDLSDDDKKTFNHFMILRALSMDPNILGDMAQLFQIFDKVPSPQFYQLLIALVPRSYQFYPWVKSKVLKHNKNLLTYVAKKFEISKYQANDYVNILIKDEAGRGELVAICKSFGLEDKEVEALFEEPKY